MRTSVDVSTASKCVTGIYTSNYNVTFYDMDYNNVPYTTEYAVKLTNQSITGLINQSTSTTITIVSTLNVLLSSTKIMSSSSPSPTKYTDNSKLLYYYNHYINLYTATVKGDSFIITIGKFIHNVM